MTNHEAAASPSRTKYPPKPSPNAAKTSAAAPLQVDASSERVRELDKKKKEREAAEAQVAVMRELAAENLRFKRKFAVERNAESTSPKAQKKRRGSAECREKLVKAVFVMWVLSVIV